ncbi:hypothetical protein AKJ16_DCAP08033 [Drosera capensis]
MNTNHLEIMKLLRSTTAHLSPKHATSFTNPNSSSHIPRSIFPHTWRWNHGVKLAKLPIIASFKITAATVAQSAAPPVDSVPSTMIAAEETIERGIYMCRFLTLLGVWGSLFGSVLCFVKTDTYLLGTVMLVFGMGLYELFVSNLDIAESAPKKKYPHRSNLLELFTLLERPKWLEIKSVNELKTKVGHVIVMLLLIGLLDKSKKAAIHTPVDLLCFSASILLSSGCLYLLSKLNGTKFVFLLRQTTNLMLNSSQLFGL